MNIIKKYIAIFMLFLSLPSSVLAYSNKIILGGQNIGINIQNKGVIIIGFYKINGKYNKDDNELMIGDTITKINNEKIYSVIDLTNSIKKYSDDAKIDLTYIRNDKEYTTSIDIYIEDNMVKTGLYVKDNIKGIGTLSYIDPETKIYGSLGHIIETTEAGTKINVKDGYIFKSLVDKIDKSYDGKPGEKNAIFYENEKYGTIDKNTIYGIFGKYTKNIDSSNLIEVGNKNDIKIGGATIYTVLNGDKIEEFNINITKINETNKLKNITFEITDDELLNKTGGIVQGMSGSPIVQNNKIIGVVTHVIIDNVNTGYGLFITTMLEEGER